MCVLKVYSNIDSFCKFKETTRIPAYDSYEKGEKIGKRIHTDYRISFDVSDREWDDFNGQVQDAIKFLEEYKKDLVELFNTHKISDAYLDFPLWSRLDKDIVNQNDHLPRELVSLAGELDIGIEMAIYATDAFNGLDSE
jgi:hypothetical protein